MSELLVEEKNTLIKDNGICVAKISKVLHRERRQKEDDVEDHDSPAIH